MSHPDATALEAAIGRALGRDPSVPYERTVSGVPKVTYVEHFDPELQGSFMAGRAAQLRPFSRTGTQVACRAGRDLAVLSQIPLRGFGFIRRDVTPWPPRAEFARYDEFVRSYLPTPWPGYLTDAFTSYELNVLRALVESECARPSVASHLAHGDFDVTAIFQVEGAYTGFIDFGEIRGADRFFDFGHFLLHDRETYDAPLFEHLYAGYSELIPPQARDRMAIVVSAVLIGLRQLCLWRGFRGRSWHHPLVAARTARIREMLATNDWPPDGIVGTKPACPM